MTRNILDHEGNIIGELTLPDDTPEEVWQARLAEYSLPPKAPNQTFEPVTPRQMRQALILSGVTLQQIEDALNSLEEPTKTLAWIEWEYATVFERHRPIVDQIGQILQWTPEQIDALWIYAASLQ